MITLGKLKRLDPREVWAREAGDFTPWLAENIEELGAALGMDLELERREAGVGDFSLDLLAKDLGSGRSVVIENQLEQTNHDHLGKLLTYAAGFDASVVIWIAKSFREEHRQALEWLNQRTDQVTEFFGVVLEVLQIDDSLPAYDFEPVVVPNEWQKTKRSQAIAGVSPRGEAYRQYFQVLIDELREKHNFTAARNAIPRNWRSFPSGTTGVSIGAVFANDNTVRVELYIDQGDLQINKMLFDWLYNRKESIEKQLGYPLQWDRLDNRRACRIYVSGSTVGQIERAEVQYLEELRRWHIKKLLEFKKVLSPLVKKGVEEINE